ncbi:TonB-dependent receptor [Mucilaginibacter koreensis]
MYKFTLHLLLFFLLCSSAIAQTGTLNVKLVEAQTNQPVEFATAAIVRLPDSVVVRRIASDHNGLIIVGGLAPHSYRLVVNLVGLKTESKNFGITTQRLNVDLGILKMEPDVRTLKSINVEGAKDPVKIKGDTTEFNAGSYKTQVNDNVENLLKKIPGVDVDRDGKITAQGKQVTKVLVDGKEFFGNDPKAATKNLPADAIDKVQVINDKTESTKNTGIDDGQRDKVINLKLKADHKKGWFGNVQAEGGTDNRYLAQLNLNHFNDKQQFSVLGLSNNVNESGFSFEDLNAFTGNNVFGSFASNDGSSYISIDRSGRANVNGAFSGVQDGLIKYNSGGLNFSDVFGKKEQLKFNASAITLVTSNYLTQLTDIQDDPNNLYTHQNSISRNTNNSYRFNLNFDYKPDTLNNIKFKPVFSFGVKSTNSLLQSYSTNIKQDSVNRIGQLLDQSGHNPSYGGQFTFNHKFKGGKGSVNAFATGNYTTNNQSYINQYTARYYAPIRKDSTTNQQTDQDNSGTYLTGTASLVRQLNAKRKLSFTLSEGYSYRKDNANQYTVDYNAITGQYDIFNAAYSGITNNQNWRYTTTAGLNKTGDVTWNLNLAVANLGLDGNYRVNNQGGPISRNNWAFLPNASASFKQKNGANLYLSLYSSAQLPQASDLQPVLNNTNPLYIRLGNPELTLSRTYSINANYNLFDQKTSSYFGFYGYFAQTWAGFSTQSIVSTSGVITTRPINTDGNFTSNLGFNWSKPTKVKGLKYNLGSYFQTSRAVNYINDNQNAVLRFTPQLYGGINYDKDVVQLSLNGSGNYNTASNSYQKAANQHYYTFDNFASASVKPTKNWRIFTDVNQRLFRGQPSSSNTSFYIWNAGIERYLLPKQNLTLSINAFDLLDKNAGLRRTITNTGQIQNIQTNTISQFFYFKIIYKLLKFDDKGGKKNNGGLIVF